MSTAKRNEEIDEQEWMRSHSPTGRNGSGQEERRIRRLDALQTRLTIRFDAAVIEEFKRLSPDGNGYQNLIHQALREWLAAQGVKELVQERIDALVGEAVESIKEAAGKAAWAFCI